MCQHDQSSDVQMYVHNNTSSFCTVYIGFGSDSQEGGLPTTMGHRETGQRMWTTAQQPRRGGVVCEVVRGIKLAGRGSWMPANVRVGGQKEDRRRATISHSPLTSTGEREHSARQKNNGEQQLWERTARGEGGVVGTFFGYFSWQRLEPVRASQSATPLRS